MSSGHPVSRPPLALSFTPPFILSPAIPACLQPLHSADGAAINPFIYLSTQAGSSSSLWYSCPTKLSLPGDNYFSTPSLRLAVSEPCRSIRFHRRRRRVVSLFVCRAFVVSPCPASQPASQLASSLLVSPAGSSSLHQRLHCDSFFRPFVRSNGTGKWTAFLPSARQCRFVVR